MMETTEMPDDNAPGELDVVRVRHTLPEHNIAAGAKGTVVMVHDTPGPPAYEVEFSGSDGATLALVTLQQNDIDFTWRFRG